MAIFLRFLMAFVITLALAVGIIFGVRYYTGSKSASDKATLAAIYKQQNAGAVDRVAAQALTDVDSSCLFFDARGIIMPVPPMQQKLVSFYNEARHVKATSQLTSVHIEDETANITAVNKVDWLTKSGRRMELRTTTHDEWKKSGGQWTCDEVKMITTSNPRLGFVVPH